MTNNHENCEVTTDEYIDNIIDNLGLLITDAIKKTIKLNDGFNKLQGIQMELDDGTIYQVTFSVVKTDREHEYGIEME